MTAMRVIPIFYDTETTGLLRSNPHIVEFSAYDPTRKIEDAVFNVLINPGCPIPSAASAVHGIKDEDVASEPNFSTVWPRLKAWVEKNKGVDDKIVFIAHNNYGFDKKVLDLECSRIDEKAPKEWRHFDTLWFSRSMHKGMKGPDGGRFSHTLQNLRKFYHIKANQAHRALADVEIMYKVFKKIIGDAPRKDVYEAMVGSHCILEVKAVVMNSRASSSGAASASSASASGSGSSMAAPSVAASSSKSAAVAKKALGSGSKKRRAASAELDKEDAKPPARAKRVRREVASSSVSTRSQKKARK